MEDWILEHDPSPSESEETGGATALPAISENSYESDDDEDLFSPGIYTPDGQEEEEETAESGAEEEEEDADENLMDTEFTRDYYRLVKFESNRSLANSEKYDHCPAETEQTPVVAAGPLLPPPDRQVALQTVLDFIAEQQRYCAIRETADADAANATATRPMRRPSSSRRRPSVRLCSNCVTSSTTRKTRTRATKTRPFTTEFQPIGCPSTAAGQNSSTSTTQR